MINIREEKREDIESINIVIKLAFENVSYSEKNEHLIIDKLRKNRDLFLSLVAEKDSFLIGHIAFSPVNINDIFYDWYGLAPVSVMPKYQNQGVGKKLITEGLRILKSMNAKGCVVLGEANYYERFGFKHNLNLELKGVPKEYFLSLNFDNDNPKGIVKYHSAFDLKV